MRRFNFKKVYNLRELGGYCTPNGSLTREGVFLRSDTLTHIQEDELDLLKAYGLTTVIDLRHDGETGSEPDPLMHDPKIDYQNIAVLDYARFTLEDMNRILLSDLYRTMAENSGFISRVFTALAEAKGAALFHCSAGKDRTGIIAALLLKLAGVEDTDIIADYQVSATYLVPKYIDREEDLSRQFINLFDSKPETMANFLDYLKTNYKDIDHYFEARGVGPDILARLRQKFTER